MTKRKTAMPVTSPTYEVCALLSKTRRIRHLDPKDVIRLRADQLADARWNGLRSTRFHVERLHENQWVKWSNPICQSDMLGIVYIVDDETSTVPKPTNPDTLSEIERMICLPEGATLETSGFDGPWDIPEMVAKLRDGIKKPPMLFVRELTKSSDDAS